MERILLILPDDWVIEKIRYTQVPTGGQVFLLDMDKIDSPLDNPGSMLNYPAFTIKRNGPTGFPERVINVETD